jgi:hypothetical protein
MHKPKAFLILMFGALLFSPAAARADLQFDLDIQFSNGDVPAGVAPWLRATVKQLDASNVELTLTNLLQDPDEFVRNWWFNSVVDPASITFGAPTGSGASVVSPI